MYQINKMCNTLTKCQVRFVIPAKAGIQRKNNRLINQPDYDKIMQNKPNLPGAWMNITKVLTGYYENVRLRRGLKNKPNQTQFYPYRIYACFNFCCGMSYGENYVF